MAASRRFAIAATALVVLTGVLAEGARADLTIKLTEPDAIGGPISVTFGPIVSSPPGIKTFFNFPGAFGDFFLNGSVDDLASSPLTGDVATAALDVENAGAALHTLLIDVTDTKYTLPAGPFLQVTSDLAVSSINNPTLVPPLNTISLKSDLNGVPLAQTESLTSKGEVSDSDVLANAAFPGPFSMSQHFAITLNSSQTPGGVASVHFDGTTSAIAVPEPDTIVQLIGAFGAMGFGLLFKRRYSS